MSTRRDSQDKQSSSSRNKENVPSKIGRPSLVQPTGKQDFFTDSYLEADSTSSSSIPTPHGVRRQIRVKQSPKHRSTKSELPGAQTVKHHRSLTRTSPIHSNGLTTPPRSRQGSFAGSPDVLSSPPAALLENYHRIDQEEDLAATEGEISDEDEERALSPVRPRSAATTPTVERSPVKRRRDETSHSVLSDPTGTSFVRQYSNPKLREIMTPHFQEAAKDREALDRVWQSQRPIAFSKAGRILFDPEEVAQSVSSSPNVRPERLVAFSKANRIKLANEDILLKAHQRTFSDVTDRVDGTSNFRQALPHNPRLYREPYFPKVHGFPPRDILQPFDNETDVDRSVRRARSESPFVHHKDPTTRSDVSVQTDIWAQQNADEPVQSIEAETPTRDAQQLHTSPDFSRKVNFDFTGHSFQVSDSPPVRAKNTLQDYQRDREIRGLAKQAVTTSRLNQLRERESQERLRQTTKSPVSEADDSPRSPPATLQRTLSNGSGPTPDRSSSHEILQRLARGSSSTPRSTTPSEQINSIVVKEKEPGKIQATPKVTGGWTDTVLPNTVKTTKRQSQYTQTPHVSAGGWVDTPAPGLRLEPLEEQSEEIPEGLTDGIAKDTASENTIVPETEDGLQERESLTRKVLNEGKDRPAENDSLALGNTTIKSLEDLLDMDETDMTSISRLGETEILGKLTSKLNRVIKTIHDAQTGISNIEHQMSQSEPESEVSVPVATEPEPTKTLFPLGLLTVSIPIPILFRRKSGKRLPQPTPLGWVLLFLWLWYMVECTMAEAYSHPIYADKYTWPEEPEPEFPFVLPTMLWRWSRLDFLGRWMKALFVGFFRMISIALGLTDGYAQEVQAPIVQSPQNMEDGFGMTNDEFL